MTDIYARRMSHRIGMRNSNLVVVDCQSVTFVSNVSHVRVRGDNQTKSWIITKNGEKCYYFYILLNYYVWVSFFIHIIFMFYFIILLGKYIIITIQIEILHDDKFCFLGLPLPFIWLVTCYNNNSFLFLMFLLKWKGK